MFIAGFGSLTDSIQLYNVDAKPNKSAYVFPCSDYAELEVQEKSKDYSEAMFSTGCNNRG